MTRPHISKPVAAAITITTLLAVPLSSAPAFAAPRADQHVTAEDWTGGVLTERVDAVDRFAEAVEISHRVVVAPATAPLVYIASGEGYADALSGAAIAAQRSAPLLLTRSTSMPAFVGDELNRLSPSDIVVLGGEATIKPSVLEQLHNLLPDATITRIGGADRYAVSRNLITDANFGAKPSTELLVTSGRVFPDALSAAPAAAKNGAPVLLVDGAQNTLSDAEKSLIRNRDVDHVSLLGGPNTITPSLEHDLALNTSLSVRRIDGATRYDVASNVGSAYFLNEAPKTAETVYLATGADYPDALAGAVLARMDNAPILLTLRDCIPAATAALMDKLKTTHIVALGGTSSVGAAVLDLEVCS